MRLLRAVVVVVGVVFLLTSAEAGSAPRRASAVKRYEGAYATHVMANPSEGLAPPGTRYEERPSFAVPPWTKRIRVTLTDDAGLPVLATTSVSGAPDLHHYDTVCTSRPATLRMLVPPKRGAVFRVAPDLGLWMNANNCDDVVVSTPSTGTIKVEFLG